MTAASPSLQIEHRDGGVLALWLNRPSVRNALDMALVDALVEAFATPGVTAFVLGSADPGWFCAGADLALDDRARARVSDRLYELYEVMVSGAAPIIAAIEGPAIGGGAQLAVASDLRIGSSTARLRFPGPGHGLSVGAWALSSLVGRGRAIDLCLTMRAVDGEEALRIGLLDRIEPDPRAAACSMAATFAQLDAPAAARVKAIVREGCDLPRALRAERAGNSDWSGSVEGLSRR